jgi:hypothetical protein
LRLRKVQRGLTVAFDGYLEFESLIEEVEEVVVVQLCAEE